MINENINHLKCNVNMQCDVKISFATGHAFACIHSIS